MMNSKTTPNDRQIRNSEITPPDDLLQQWVNNYFGYTANGVSLVSEKFFATQAAQWGWEQRGAANEAELQKARDEELNACEEWLREARNHGFGYDHGKILSDKLRAARRPKPKSLAEEALEALNEVVTDQENTISRALKRLQELEGQQ